MAEYLGIDQYGTHYNLKKYPRKELLEWFDRKHADKMYRDVEDGVRHVGYIIGGLWIEIFKISPWKESE